MRTNPLSWDLQQRGTPGLVEPLNVAGVLPTRNFKQGAFEGMDNLKWEVYEKELLTARRSCYACAVRCNAKWRWMARFLFMVDLNMKPSVLLGQIAG